MNAMPCGLEDDRVRFEPDLVEEESPLTDMEKRIEWICSEWADAITNDTHDDWRDVRMMIHGAMQALNYCHDRHEDRMALMALGSVAFENSIDCIQRNRYEGAAK